MKKTIEEQRFIIKRCQDTMPIVENLKNTISTQESLI